jgi:hypothetical protein
MGEKPDRKKCPNRTIEQTQNHLVKYLGNDGFPVASYFFFHLVKSDPRQLTACIRNNADTEGIVRKRGRAALSPDPPGCSGMGVFGGGATNDLLVSVPRFVA